MLEQNQKVKGLLEQSRDIILLDRMQLMVINIPKELQVLLDKLHGLQEYLKV
jgi:hypothetical protein